MESVFLKLVNLGISASWLVLAVLVLRLVFRRAPKWIFCLLWALVALRLVCPFSLESTLSLIPSAQPLPPEILDTARPQIHSGIPAINSAVNPLLERGMAPAPGASTNPTQVWFLILSYIWVIGALVMALYALISYWLLKRRVATATLLRENIRQSEYVDTPFVLGLFRPIIYLPYGLEQKEQNYVVAHEKAHIKRRDHWWKPLGFSLLTVYWFNPLMWLAYILLCRDIEGACDEKAIREMGLEDRRGYSTALLQCSIHRHRLAACPLAFGEVGVKVRIKSVMNYKRPAFWIVAAALAACVVAAVCFLTDPPSRREFSMDGTNLANLDPQDIVEQIENLEDTSQLYVNGDNFEITLTSDFQWESSETVRFFYFKNQETYSAQLRISPQENKYFITQAGRWPEQDSIFLLVNYLEALKYLPQAEIILEYRSSEASGPANQREEFKVGFFACYDRVWELVNLRNDKQHYQEGFFVFDIATFNERVVREAILNAVSHRNYQFGGSIFVRQFRDRLVVESPGGLPFGITLDNILDRQLPRNRRIAEILSLCGMVERSGQGMNLMFELSVQEAKPLPDFTGTDDFFVSVTLNGLIIDKAMLSVINRISERGAELLSTEDFLVIDALYHERPLNEKMQSRLNRLIEMGIVEHIGRKKYVLARSLYAATGKTGVHTRHVGLDRDTNKELLLKHIRQNNEVGTPFKELQQVLPGLNRNQIQVLMRELKEDGKVVCKGKTSAARWFIIK